MSVDRNERWRDVAGWAGKYSVSDFGRIRGPKGIHDRHIRRD